MTRFPWKALVETGEGLAATKATGRVSWHHRECPVFTGQECDCYEQTTHEILRERDRSIKKH